MTGVQTCALPIFEEYLQECISNGFSVRTVGSYRSSLRPWQSFVQSKGITDLTEITPENLMEYRHYLQGSYRSRKDLPIAVSTQAQKLGALKEFLRFCARAGRILLDPAQRLPMPKLPKPLPRGILTPRQMKKLLALPDTRTLVGFRDRVILELFYATGMRRNELACLAVRDCQVQERRIFVRHGKGGKQRWIPIGQKVQAIVQQYLKQVRPALMGGKRHDTLLVGNAGGPLRGPRIYTIVSAYLKRMGVRSDCHGLRHTCATHLLKGKANIRVIQSILGHESLASTQIYTHVDISDMARAIARSHPRESMDLSQEDGIC